MYIVYSVVYITIFAFVAWIIPFTIFLYETDEDDSMASRICWSMLFAFGIASIWCGAIFISYIWLSYYTDTNGITQQLSIPMYIMTSISFIGWIFLSINGGIGLIFLPFELILFFFSRPKKLTKEEALEKKRLLEKNSIDFS